MYIYIWELNSIDIYKLILFNAISFIVGPPSMKKVDKSNRNHKHKTDNTLEKAANILYNKSHLGKSIITVKAEISTWISVKRNFLYLFLPKSNSRKLIYFNRLYFIIKWV
jgi:hypothetical protein